MQSIFEENAAGTTLRVKKFFPARTVTRAVAPAHFFFAFVQARCTFATSHM
jgi:hypothetical protein